MTCLSDRKFVLLDGGSGTELARIGCQGVDGDPLWSSRLLKTDPQKIIQTHRNFLESGSDVLTTVSYQASVEGFVEHLGVSKEAARDLIRDSVKLAREVCAQTGKSAVIAGSVGPYGACLCDNSEFTGTYPGNMTKEDFKSWHRPRVESLLEGGCDMLAIETIPILKEAEALVELLTEYPHARASVSFSCKDSQHTCHGEKFSDAVESVSSSEQVVAVGLNCTSPVFVSGLLESIRHLHIGKNILVKPNSGETWESKAWKCDSKRLVLETQVSEWVNLGATWVGGCCRVTPDDIAKMRLILDSLADK